MSDIGEKLLDDLRRKEVHIDCVRMELVRSNDGKVFVGPGYIRQKPTRDFEIKIYSTGKLDFRESFLAWQSTKPGVLFGEKDHFSLAATDEHQRAWSADRIIEPGSSGHIGGEGFLVTADCHEIALTEPRYPEEKNNWLALRCFDTIAFPRNARTVDTTLVGNTRNARWGRLNAAELVAAGLSFCFEDDDGLSVFASAKEGLLRPHAEERITEAMTFAFGIMPRWAMLIRSQAKEKITRLRNHEERTKKTSQWPPYIIETVDPTESVWRMFDLYLGHVIKDEVRQIHGLSQILFGLSHGHESSIEGHALAVSVAVESVLDQFHQTIGNPTTEHIKGVESLITYLKEWDGTIALIERAVGSVSGLKRARPDDRLRELVAIGVIGDAERQAWKKLRNTVTHGDWHVYESRLQELLDITGKVVGLFNQLVFHLIGYTGQQTDYGTQGWPTVEYPPKPPAPSTDDEIK